MLNIQLIKTPEDIEKCHEAFASLRPHFTDPQFFVSQVLLQCKEGYHIAAIIGEDDIPACIGFRLMTTLAWGKIVYIDDLIAKEQYRGQGYGHVLLQYVVDWAKEQGCAQVHLDTGYTRHAAHKSYLKNGFEFNCHHLSLVLSS